MGNNKKKILNTLGGSFVTSILISSFAMQPTGNMKQAVQQYEISSSVSAIQSSALAEQGSLSSPIISKSLNTDSPETHNGIYNPSPFTIPDYISSGHRETAYDAEGNPIDLIAHEQSVKREITLSNGETYTEVYGWKDDQNNYIDSLPAGAAVGVVNTGGTGNADGHTYQKYTSTDNQSIVFTNGASPNAQHGVVNTESSNGPTTIYDEHTDTWFSVETGATDQVGDGSGGEWTSTPLAWEEANGIDWPRAGWNPPTSGTGVWDLANVRTYALALYDHYITNDPAYDYLLLTKTAYDWITGVQIGDGSPIAGPDYEISRTEFVSWINNSWGGSYFSNPFSYFFFGGSGADWESTPLLTDPNLSAADRVKGNTMGGTIDLHWSGGTGAGPNDSYFGGAGGAGTVESGGANMNVNAPGSNGSWVFNDGSQDNEWTYDGPVFNSDTLDAGTGSSTVYGSTTWDESAGTTIYDQNFKVYPSLPKNLEKQAVLGYNGPGVGDETGNTYYEGTLTEGASQPIQNPFTPGSKPGWIEDTHNVSQIGDGSGNIYERALFYYDDNSNLVHNLPSGEYLVGEEGNLFTNNTRTTGFDTTANYEGVGIGSILNWINDNQALMTISSDARAAAADLGIELIITETDARHKRVLIAIQAAVELMAGVSSQSTFDSRLAQFATIVDITQTDMDAISLTVSNASAGAIGFALSEGYTEDINFFGKTFNAFGDEATMDGAEAILNSAGVAEFFAISSTMATLEVETPSGIEYLYYDKTGTTIAQDLLSLAVVENNLDPIYALPELLLLQHFSLASTGIAPIDDKLVLSNVRYTNFDYDITTMDLEMVVSAGDEQTVFQETVTFTNTYMDWMMNELSKDEIYGNRDMLLEAPMSQAWQYSVGTEAEVDAGTASFALPDSFQDKFEHHVDLLSVDLPVPPVEDDREVEFEFMIEYQGIQKTYTQSFRFGKSRSQQFVEDAVAQITEVTSTVSHLDRTVADLTSRAETFRPFVDFIINDGSTNLRMSFSNMRTVGGVELDRSATTIDFTVDITMGAYTLYNHPLTLLLNHSLNTEIADNISGDDFSHTTPGIATIVDDLTDADWNDEKWWTVQSAWLDILDITGIVVLGNFNKIDERTFTVDLRITIGSETKDITVTQQVGFNLIFAPVIDESTTGITDPDRLQDLIDYMKNFDAQTSVTYAGSFIHAFELSTATPAELMQAWQEALSTTSGNAFIQNVEINDVQLVTKYEKVVSFRITLEDSYGFQISFNKLYTFAESAVEIQLRDATTSMITTSHDQTGQLTDEIMALMLDINDWNYDSDDLGLLDTLRVVSVTNTGKVAHITFEFGFSGPLGSDSKELSMDVAFNRRGDQDTAFDLFSLGYSVSDLSAYYDPNDVDGNGNDWTNVDQSLLNEVVRLAAVARIRYEIEDEITFSYANAIPNIWADLAALQVGLEAITTDDIIAALQAEIIAGSASNSSFVNDQWEQLIFDTIEARIFDILASDWKLNSASEVIAEIVKYNSTFDIEDYYLQNVNSVVNNPDFDTEISLQITIDTLLPNILALTLAGISEIAEPDYYKAVEDATSDHFDTAYNNVIGTNWTDIADLINILAAEVSQVVIDGQLSQISGVLNSTTDESDRTLGELIKSWSIFTGEEIKVVSFGLESGTDIAWDVDSFAIEVFLTFGAVVNQRQVLTLQLDKTINQAIIDAFSEYSFTVTDAKTYPTIEYMLLAMGESLTTGGSGTITDVSYIQLLEDFIDPADFSYVLDPSKPLTPVVGSEVTDFTIGLTITVGNLTRDIEITIKVGEAIDFSSPEYQPGGSFDFDSHFVTITDVYDNAFDLERIGNEVLNHIGITDFLTSSFVSVASIMLSNNSGVDIFSREFYATFILRDSLGNTRTFTNQLVHIEGGLNKAESVMATTTDQDIDLMDSDILLGQLTDDLLDTGLWDLTTYAIGNDLDVLNDFQLTDVSHRGKFATVKFTVGYDDGNGNSDHVEYSYIFDFAYRADVAWSLDYYGLGMTIDELGITWSPDQSTGNVEQSVIDNKVITGLQDFLADQYIIDLQTFVDAGIFTSGELRNNIIDYIDQAKVEEIATDGQSMDRDAVIAKYKAELIVATVNLGLDTIAVDTLRADDWAQVASKYPQVTAAIERSIELEVAAGSFDASNIWPMLGRELAIVVASEVEDVAENGANGVAGWVMAMIGDAKPGFIWMIHSTIEAQLSAGFNDAPILSQEVSGIHVNQNSTNGWFIDEISNLRDFSRMDEYIIHLSTMIARIEIPAQVSDIDLLNARNSFRADIAETLSQSFNSNSMSVSDIDKYLDILLTVDNDHPQGWPEANFDAIYTPEKYYAENMDQIIKDTLIIVGLIRAQELGFTTTGELLSANATFLAPSGNDLVLEANNANFTTSETEEQYLDLYKHFLFVKMSSVYTDAYVIYQNTATDNVVSSYSQFLDTYISKMTVYLGGLEDLDYGDVATLEGKEDLIALRVDQIRNITNIQGTIDRMINNIGLSQEDLDDYPYADLKQFTITLEELEAHLYDEAMIQILVSGGPFETAADSVDLPDDKYEYAKTILDNLMSQDYPSDEAELKITIDAAILFSSLDDDYYIAIISMYNVFKVSQTPTWVPTVTIEEVIDAMDPIIDRIFFNLKNDPGYDIVDARIELDDSQQEIAVELSWIKYEEAFIEIFEQLRNDNRQDGDKIYRMSVEELEEYVVDMLGAESLSAYIAELATDDRAFSTDGNPNTQTMESHLVGMIDRTIQYAQDLYNDLIADIGTAAGYGWDDVMDRTSLPLDAIIIDINGTISTGGTSTEIKALRAQMGKYVFELIIETESKPDPEVNMNGWLVPFAAMITKTEDYATISKIIQERIEAGEGSFDNWGFEDIADMMNIFVDTTVEEETYNTTTGKILMDKFIRSNGTASNAWSTTMWLGPVPLRMTYGQDGDISRMQTILMDREDPETITSIALSEHYNQKEMTLKFGMADGTTVYVRYVQDADDHINVILQRIDSEGNWLTSEMYREADITQGFGHKNYRIFRDTDLEAFMGLDSEFAADMVNIYDDGTQANTLTTMSTIKHVWGENPTVDSSTNIGDATSALAVVKKDANGNTHIQMNQKDLRISNSPNAITATITAGGFALMWLWWTFFGGLVSVGSTMVGTFGFMAAKQERKRRFFKVNPQFTGASTRKVIRLQKLLAKQSELNWTFNHGPKMEVSEKAAASARLKIIGDKVVNLRTIVLAEAEADKFARGFKRDIAILESARMTYQNIDSAAHSSMALKNITAKANKVMLNKKNKNLTQEFKMKYSKPVKSSKMTKLAKAKEESLAKEEAVKAKEKNAKDLLKDIKTLKTGTKTPVIDKPLKGVDVDPITKLGFVVESAIFKRAEIDKNAKVQTISLVLTQDGKEISKDVKVTYKSSVNAEIIKNLSRYTIESNGLSKYGTTSNSSFTEANIEKSFSINAPGTTIKIVKGSLVIVDEKTFSVTLNITVGKSSTTMSFKSSI